jgi:hypothetical protein
MVNPSNTTPESMLGAGKKWHFEYACFLICPRGVFSRGSQKELAVKPAIFLYTNLPKIRFFP